MLIINIEITYYIRSISLQYNGKLINQISSYQNYKYKSITMMIKKIMSNNDYKNKKLSAITITKNPGSFTGLKIGTSIAKGICYIINIPLISINTLKSIIYYINNKNKKLLCPIIDTKKINLYYTLLNNKLLTIEKIKKKNKKKIKNK